LQNIEIVKEFKMASVFLVGGGWQEKEETFMAIQRAVQQMVAMPIEEMYAMGEINSL